MIVALVRWLRRGAAYAVGLGLADSPPEPTAEDDRGAGI
jgi:hypothetical protein